MCYHYAVTSNQKKLEDRFHVKFKPETSHQPIYHSNGFAHPQMPIITADEPDAINMYNWGLIPHFMKTEAEANKLRINTLNSKGETVFDLPSFRMYITKKRCLVLADGFFEWMHVGKEKYPHYIYMKDKEPFAFAGIYSHWKNPTTNEVLRTYTILTTPATTNSLMKKIHNVKERMPVILRPEMERQWLQPIMLKDEINNLIVALEDDMLAAHTVSKNILSKTEPSNQTWAIDVCDYPELANFQ